MNHMQKRVVQMSTRCKLVGKGSQVVSRSANEGGDGIAKKQPLANVVWLKRTVYQGQGQRS